MSYQRPDMLLPEGFTCNDCFAFKRHCGPLGITKPENTQCDFHPVRFQLSLEGLNELKKAREAKTV